MIFGSVCSGIEAASVAWKPLGWRCAFVSEIEPFPCRVLAHHYPDVPNRGDMTRYAEWPDDAIDVLVGGTPCQSFSVAGLRAGMADPRGNLALVFLGLVGRARPRWVVWENVPGVLSSNRGRDFGAFLGGLGQLGYGWCYRVLDAQYFGLAQRRKRVFVVASLGGWQRAAAVLLERASLRGDSAPSREAGARVAGCLDGGAHGGGFDDNDARAGKCVEVAHDGVCHSAKGGDPTTDNYVAHSLRAAGHDAGEDGTGRGTPLVAAPLTGGGNPNSNAPGRRKEDDVNLAVVATGFHARQDPISESGLSLPLEAKGGQAVAFRAAFSNQGMELEMAPTLDTEPMAASTTLGVRRLTPRECERLQGFPDDYTLIPGAKDSPRYRALGNSMAVPVMRWIGWRIASVEAA